MSFKARPTIYKGIHMRSRLEATFAQHLDHSDCGRHWRYEPECFADETGQYLPDFYATGCVSGKPCSFDSHSQVVPVYTGGTYYEVKPFIDDEVVADVAPRMERIWSSKDRAEAHLVVIAPATIKSSDDCCSFSRAHVAMFHKGDWYIDDRRSPSWTGFRN